MKSILFRTATISMSLNLLLKGQLKFLNRHYDVSAISGNDDFLLELKQREQVKVFDVKMQRRISPLEDLVSLFRLFNLFRTEKPLIVHSITPKAGLLTMMAGKMAGVPIRMHTFTGLIFPGRTGLMQMLLINMDKLLCKFATNIYPEGQGVRNDLIKYKITSKPLEIIANGNVNGVDTDYFNPCLISNEDNYGLKKLLNIQTEDIIFIFIGRLVGDKGINELIKAFKNLSSEYLNVKLLLVGEKESDLDPLQEETELEISINKKIISLGFQKDIRPYLSVSDVLVFPSYREGFPNVVMQAGAMGLPSIVTNINGSNEIIIEGENGIIIPVKDVTAIYSSMVEMIDSKNLRYRMSQNSRRMIVSRYEQQLVWQAILAEYKKLEKNV